MMKTLLVGGLVLLAALAIAPSATADPVSCPDTNPLDDGFAYCTYDIGSTHGCAQVNIGSGKHCT